MARCARRHLASEFGCDSTVWSPPQGSPAARWRRSGQSVEVSILDLYGDREQLASPRPVTVAGLDLAKRGHHNAPNLRTGKGDVPPFCHPRYPRSSPSGITAQYRRSKTFAGGSAPQPHQDTSRKGSATWKPPPKSGALLQSSAVPRALTTRSGWSFTSYRGSELVRSPRRPSKPGTARISRFILMNSTVRTSEVINTSRLDAKATVAPWRSWSRPGITLAGDQVVPATWAQTRRCGG